MSRLSGHCWRGGLLSLLCLAHAREVQAACGEALADTHRLLYTHGFSHRQTWEVLPPQLERGDFLHAFLVPLTVNAIRAPPPETPP